MFIPLLFSLALGASPLSLDDAVALAERQAPALAARRAAVESADLAIAPAGALPDPQLVAGVENLPVDGDDAFSVTRDFMTMRKVGLMQDIVPAAKRRARTARAEAEAGRERAMLASETLAVREAAARAWIARAGAERKLALLRELEPNAKAQADAARAALTAGRAGAAEGVEASAASALLDDRIDQATRELAEAQAELARWIPESSQRELGGSGDWSSLGADPAALVARVEGHRELLAYDAATRAADAELALAQAEKRPDWSVELGYARRGPMFSSMAMLEFRVALPIFPAHRQDATIASKRAAVEQLAAEREAARRMHAAELEKIVAQWRASRARAKRYEESLLPLAAERADAALAAYRGGAGTLHDALAALEAAVETRLAYVDVETALGSSWAALHYAFAEEH